MAGLLVSCGSVTTTIVPARAEISPPQCAQVSGRYHPLFERQIGYELKERHDHGDRTIWDDIARIFEKPMWAVVHRLVHLRTGDSDLRKEVFQEVWCLLMSQRDRIMDDYNPDGAPFGAYLSRLLVFRVALVCRTLQRRRRTDTLPSEASLVDPAEPRSAAAWEAAEVLAWLRRFLTPSQQQYLDDRLQRDYEDLPPKSPSQGVRDRQTLCRIRQRLQDILGPNWASYGL